MTIYILGKYSDGSGFEVADIYSSHTLAAEGASCCLSPIARFPADHKDMAIRFAKVAANVK